MNLPYWIKTNEEIRAYETGIREGRSQLAREFRQLIDIPSNDDVKEIIADEKYKDSRN